MIAKTNNLDIHDLIICSGGAALSDHIAVTLYLENKISNLKLYFPCDFDHINNLFMSYNNTAKSANLYHRNFSNTVSINSLSEITKAINKGAKTLKYNGFFKRNDEVAKSDYLIAFTFDYGDKISIWTKNESNISTKYKPITGGTKNTWNKSNNIRIHIPINLLNIKSLIDQ